MVNIVDDGFEKSAHDGLKVAQLGSGRLVSFYNEITVNPPQWAVGFSTPSYGGGSDPHKSLNFFYGNDPATGLTLAKQADADDGEGAEEARIRVGINIRDPEHELDVSGIVASDGRLGREGSTERQVRADGKWHPVITGLDGCQAFEIMAGVGKKNTGRYALLHAFALNTFFSKKDDITCHQAHFSSRCDQIDLRWTGSMHDYTLEMRTRCSFEQNESDEVYIRYYITQLWFDPFMERSTMQAGPESDEG
ncbi:MAG: hypothetical protein CO017_05555 [Zetaproteobacteria bacterium CG_4_8_14_3_um_filter_59_5]|nr:MAG: hypothetical protein COX56_06055 [Zetaproteobacteria bacterium CG23_combo_of_CG06-09_8_20_14_all_59_86]PIU96606.1 MAG: hypothetical protein COS62_08100 [Zetaproteobacteria bacterium CG03_land_8_20_14_0_80_59_51]PJC70400.1 MAG: hypothetical protein CO017_05555 [Zetaproteobacteria bacterium CG_4_8_14_3_um_filter_59_5]HCS13699.1 hypothetical protein [Zetaproteobacteria bacterium]